jgi:CIC family chloride channel protein
LGEGEINFSLPSKIWLIPLITGAGGLISGILTYIFAPEAEGHGTDSAIEAFHFKKGDIRKRVPIIKVISSAILIGTGGSAGREGPVAQTGAGFGSFLSQVFKLPARMKRILVVAGIGAGIGSIFRAPFGGALFSVEVLYREMDMELDALLSSILAAVIGYSVFGATHGWSSIFSIPSFKFQNPELLFFFALLGILLGFMTPLYVEIFYGTKNLFDKLPVIPHVKPAIGGLLLGIIAMFFPYIMGMGYGWLQLSIFDRLPLLIIVLFPFLKIMATSLSVGSGGSGGIFAPTLVIGGMFGAIFGKLLSLLFPQMQNIVAPFIILGMAGFAAGTLKVPLAGLIMVLEMTGGYSLLAPALIVIVFSYITSGNYSLYEKQVKNKLDSPAHIGDFAIDILEKLKVRDAMVHALKPIFVSINSKFEQILKTFSKARCNILCVRDEKGKFAGIIPLNEIRRVMFEGDYLKDIIVAADIMSYDEELVLNENENLKSALGKFVKANVEELPVVENDEVKGILTRKDILITYSKSLE